MKKSEIATQYEYKSCAMFSAAAIAFAANSVLTIISSKASSGVPTGFALVIWIFSIALALFGGIITIEGFSVYDRFCRLSEENECYYVGKRLKIFSVICLVLSIVFALAAFFFYFLLDRYNAAESLSEQDKTAAFNIACIAALFLLFYQIFSVATPYIFYLWKIHRYTDKTNSLNNFALLTMIIFIVQLVIGIMNTGYSLKSHSAFLENFSYILSVVKYLLLFLLFALKKKGISQSADGGERAKNG